MEPNENQQEDWEKGEIYLLKEASKDADVCYRRFENFIQKREKSLIMRRAAKQFNCLYK
jgi:hypothetical protein